MLDLLDPAGLLYRYAWPRTTTVMSSRSSQPSTFAQSRKVAICQQTPKAALPHQKGMVQQSQRATSMIPHQAPSFAQVGAIRRLARSVFASLRCSFFARAHTQDPQADRRAISCIPGCCDTDSSLAKMGWERTRTESVEPLLRR